MVFLTEATAISLRAVVDRMNLTQYPENRLRAEQMPSYRVDHVDRGPRDS